MKKLLLCLLSCCIIVSCKQEETFDYSLLEGDWVFTNLALDTDPTAPTSPWGSMPLSLRNVKTSANDSVYKIVNNSIWMKMRNNHREDRYSWIPKFTVKRLSKDSLTVYSLRDSLSYTLYNSDLIRDTTIHVDRICYSTSPCFGHCPIFNLEINKDDSVYYYGLSNTRKSGLHTGIISHKTFAYFEELIQKADLEKLDSVYNYSVTDNQSCCMRIYYNNGKIKTMYIYPVFHFDLPFINLLSDNFINIDTYTPLEKSEKSYRFPYNYRISPIIETVKFTPPVVE